jgi:uncharacterized protein YndB with AHSA1/START domain
MRTTNEPAEAVIIERTFNAPVARVWAALTDVEEMRKWYFDLKEFKPEVGFEFEFVVEHEGDRYHHLCRVTEAIPQKKIAYTWRYKDEPGDSLVSFELFPEGNKTRLKLTHEGLETFPKTPTYARNRFEAGWNALTGELEQFLERSGEKVALEVKRLIRAPRDRVFAAWTDPEQLRQWFGPIQVQTRDFVADVRVGGGYRWDLTTEEGEKMTVWGEYREIEPGRRIVFTWQWDDDEAWKDKTSLVTVDLADGEGGTELRLRHEKLPSEASRDRHHEGWTSVLGRLGEFCERSKLFQQKEAK